MDNNFEDKNNDWKINSELEIRIKSDTSFLVLVRNFISNTAKRMGFEQDDIDMMELSVDEACSNVIRHAYQNRNDGEIKILVKTDPEKMIIKISDYGIAFDPNSVPIPKIEDYRDKFKKGGLGIFLMKKAMDKVEYKIKPGIKNVVKMIKYIKKKRKEE